MCLNLENELIIIILADRTCVGEITMICDEDILSEVEVIIYTILTCFFFFCVKWYENCITFLSCQKKKNTHMYLIGCYY